MAALAEQSGVTKKTLIDIEHGRRLPHYGTIAALCGVLKVAPTELVGTYAYVNPVIAVLLGAVFLNEAITSWVLLAGAAIVVSVALNVRAQRAPKPAAEAESELPELDEEGATLAA